MNSIPNTGNKFQSVADLHNTRFAYRLARRNYLKWSQLKEKGKGSHLIDNAPYETDSKFKPWDEKDSMIMALLWNSMVLEIIDTCVFRKSAKEIWEVVGQTYSEAKDAAQIYDLKVKTLETKHEIKLVTEYANHLWMELDHYRVMYTKR